MICELNPWNIDSYGGFLDNKVIKNDIVTGSNYHGHKLENRDNIYKAVNNISSIKFNINKDLFNYIENEGKYLLDSYNPQNKLQLDLTMKIAKIYYNIPFYLNTSCDWRGRIYTNSFFISYQGGDLSRSLVEFDNGEVLNKKGLEYLKIFGANCYGDNMNKDSFSNRIKWVNKNITKIINLDKTLISEANNPIHFAYFCINMKKLHNNKALINIPIFLDGCNL